jgi:hypothetical protein
VSAARPEVKAEHDKAIASSVATEADDEVTELGTFIVNGRCPKCAKVVTKGHKKHLAMCTGKPVYDPSLAELIELAVKKVQTDNEKLNELELGGLIEVNDDHATFMVIGSTGAPPA